MEDSLFDRIKNQDNKFAGMFDTDEIDRDTEPEEEMMLDSKRANHGTNLYRRAVRALLDDFSYPPATADEYKQVVYYCLDENSCRSIAVSKPEIYADEKKGTDLMHIYIRYYFPEFEKVCPGLSHACLATEIQYDREVNKIAFDARLYRSGEDAPYKCFTDLFSAIAWCVNDNNRSHFI